MIEGNNCCVMCGAIIPEGTMICWNCEHENLAKKIKDTYTTEKRTKNLLDYFKRNKR